VKHTTKDFFVKKKMGIALGKARRVVEAIIDLN
jgi:hypothetical protein